MHVAGAEHAAGDYGAALGCLLHMELAAAFKHAAARAYDDTNLASVGLSLSRAASRFPQVQHAVGDYGAALGCLLRAEPAAAFEYAAAHLGEPGCPAGLRQAVLGAMERLADADGEAAARLVLRYFPGDHSAVLAGFAAAPERQFRYLRGALQVCL